MRTRRKTQAVLRQFHVAFYSYSDILLVSLHFIHPLCVARIAISLVDAVLFLLHLHPSALGPWPSGQRSRAESYSTIVGALSEEPSRTSSDLPSIPSMSYGSSATRLRLVLDR